MNLSPEQLLEISQYSFVRMDGAWFLALAKKLGKETAWEIDVEAWSQFSYVFGKKIKKDIIPNPVWPESFLDMLDIFSKVLKIEGREVFVESDIIIVRVTDCETQKAIAKAGVCFTDPDIFLPFLVILFWEVFSEMRPPALVSFKS